MAFELDPNYKQVPERIADFKAKHPEGSLQPANVEVTYRIETIGDKVFIVYTAAAYRTPDDQRPGIGTAWEPFPGRTPYTKDSELQNAETSAWGRAIIAALASESKTIASAEDVRNRRAEAEAPEPEPVPIDPTEMLRRDLGKVAKEQGIGAELAGALLVEKFGEGTTSKSLNVDQLRGAAAAFKRYGNQRRKVELLRNQLELTEEGLLASAATILNLEADGVKSLDDLVMHEVDALVVDLELRAALGKDMLEEDKEGA